MFDSARSKIAIDKWAGQHSINGQRWGVAIQKESSTEDADHVVQRVSKRWVLQPQEYWDPKTPGNNIAKIICTPEHNFSPEGNFDNLQRLAEFISLRIDKSKFQPSSII